MKHNAVLGLKKQMEVIINGSVFHIVYFQAQGETVFSFEHLTKHKILQPNRTHESFRIGNIGRGWNAVRFNLYVFE